MPLIRRLESAPSLTLRLQAWIAKPPVSRTFVLSRPVFVFAACLLLTMVRGRRFVGGGKQCSKCAEEILLIDEKQEHLAEN
ncbi:hypothetical protein CEXT_689431 [Caerostris extrusa]|uniref:Uncharacterized protein n=1 Tax=Caerostris extrusa TaxID=172846 RepID=A0AAV4RQC9_CAEEX|nr:hypothetical protein CEXT_689431 [Caerostris extrusa]